MSATKKIGNRNGNGYFSYAFKEHSKLTNKVTHEPNWVAFKMMLSVPSNLGNLVLNIAINTRLQMEKVTNHAQGLWELVHIHDMIKTWLLIRTDRHINK